MQSCASHHLFTLRPPVRWGGLTCCDGCVPCFEPTWAFPWKDAVPLGVVEMDYSFTERGSLPVGLEASSLAAAFGPEPRPDQAPARAGVSARIQVGDALVSLLEHHRKHRRALLPRPSLPFLPILCAPWTWLACPGQTISSDHGQGAIYY